MNNQEAIFKAKATQRLPLYIEYGGIIYKLVAQMLMGGGFRITYGWYNGTEFDWNQPKLYDKIYNNNETDDDVLTDTIRSIGSKGNHLSEVEANHRFRTKYVAPVKVDVITPAPQQPVTVAALRKELMTRRTSLIAMMKTEKDHDIKCELFGRKQELGAIILRLKALEIQSNLVAGGTAITTMYRELQKLWNDTKAENIKLKNRLDAQERMGAKLTERLQEINSHASEILSITRQ